MHAQLRVISKRDFLDSWKLEFEFQWTMGWFGWRQNISTNNMVQECNCCCCCSYIGWSKKKCSIKVNKKCTKNWRWPCRELKTWYMGDNIMVFLFTKKYFSYIDLYSWYGHSNVKYWQFWHWPNVFKICSKIVLCL